MKLVEEIQKIAQQAEQADTTTRVIHRMKLQQAVRQGDIYLVKIDRDVSKLQPLDTQQLIPGTSQGSRHVAEPPARLFVDDNKVLDGIAPTALRGPVVDSSERFLVTHPEHAHISLPKGTYQVLYQLDFQAQRRVAD